MRLKNPYLDANDASANAGSNKLRLLEQNHTPSKHLCSSFTQFSKLVCIAAARFPAISQLQPHPTSSHHTQPSSLTDTMNTNYELGDCASIVKSIVKSKDKSSQLRGLRKRLFLEDPQDNTNVIGVFPKCKTDKFLKKQFMTIVVYAMPKEDCDIVSALPSEQDPEAQKAMLARAQKDSMQEIMAFEARAEENPNKMISGGKKLEPDVTGQGKRVNATKKRLSSNTKDAGMIPLQARSAVLAKAPPRNNYLARTFAARKKKEAAVQVQEDTWKAAINLENSTEATTEEKEAAWKVAEAAFEKASAADTALARSEDMVVEDNAGNCLESHLDDWTSARSDHVVVELDMCEDREKQ